jgi:hypothetical protein
VVVDIAQLIQHTAQAFVLRVFAYLIFVCSHWTIAYSVFNPCQVGRQTHCFAAMLDMSANAMKRV